jgi:signal transduction histidine kinase
MVNDLLDLEKIETGEIPLTPVALKSLDLVARAVREIEPLLSNKEIELVQEIEPIRFRGDSHCLHRILINLLSNAIKYSPAGGKIVVRCKRLSGDQMCFEVQDEGAGVPDVFVHDLFNRFKQADTSSTRNHEGTGLGLAICKSLVSAHGGGIGYSHGDPRGANFWFTLPLSVRVGGSIDAP